MIETFEGRIGGGKTFSVMERMFLHWCKGGAVYSNVDVDWEESQKYVLATYRVKLDPGQFTRIENEQICDFPKLTPEGTFDLPVLVVIDEAHLWLISSATKREEKVVKVLEFLSQSRKQHTDVIFITQSVKNMDCKISRLNQFVWRFRDMSKWKMPGLGIYYPFPQIKQFQFDYDGKTLQDTRWVWKDKKIFKTYHSHAMHSPIARLQNAVTKFAVEKVQRKEVPDWWVAVAAGAALAAVLAL